MNMRKKNSRQRGSKTHGWGSMKKHRGAGSRGGRGAAGSGKRGDAKKPSIWKNTKYAGKYGFKSKSTTPNAIMTLAHLENHKKTLITQKLISMKGDVYTADLSKAGFTRLLGTGKVASKWNIIVPYATASAIEKVKNAGGKVKTESAEAVEGTEVKKED